MLEAPAMAAIKRWSRWVIVSGLFAAAIALIAAPDQFSVRSFERTAILENLEENTAGVSVGDLDSDGWLDVVFGKGHHTPLHNRVLLSDGKGRFTAANLGNTADRTYSAALADIDRDGDLDVIVSNDLPDRKPIYKNDGRGSFTLAGYWGEASWPTRHVSVTDVDGDGYPDIIAANAGASMPLRIYFPSFVCLNDRTGSFPFCRPIPSESAVRIKAADFDGNGTIDLFVPHRDGGRSFLLWNNGEGFEKRTPFRTRTFVGPETASIRVSGTGDFNRDGRPDLVVCDGAKKTISIFLNAGSQRFQDPFVLPTRDREAFAVAVADLNNDGAPDIAAGYYYSTGSVYFNAGDGRTFHEVSWNDGKGLVDDIAFGDMDNDGWLDIVAARTGAPNGIWFNIPSVQSAKDRATVADPR